MDPGARAPTFRDWITRRPLVAVAALLIVGISAHDAVPLAPRVWAATLAVLVALAAVARHRAAVGSGLIALAVAVGGVAAGQVTHHAFAANDVAAFAGEARRLAQLELYLDDDPRLLARAFDAGPPMPPRQVALARVVRVKTWAGWVPATGEALVQIARPHPRLAAGQTVRVLGMLERPAPAMNPGQFDFADYYRERRVLASVRVEGPGQITVVAEQLPGPVALLRRRVRRLLATGFDPADAIDRALLGALVLGDRDPAMRDVQDQFRRTGTSHHLAISGMHVAVAGGLVFGLARLLRLRPRAALLTATAFVLLYGLVALPSPPVVRSVILWTAFAGGFLARRRPDPLNLLAVAAVAMLAYHPLDLFNAGFQLSFGTVLGLIVLAPPLYHALAGAALDDPRFAGVHRPTGPLRLAGRWLDAALLQAVSAGLVAWAVSMPLVAWHFGQLNPWAVLCSIGLSLPVAASLVAGLLKVGLTLAAPPLAGVWAWGAAVPVELMRWTVDRLASMPAADVPLPQPSLWAVAYCYVALAACFLLRRRGGSLKWAGYGAPASAVAVLFVLPYGGRLDPRLSDPPPPGTSSAASSADAGELRVTLLAVGAGQCAVVESPGGRVALVDAGSSSLADVVDQALGPYLRSRGVTAVEQVFVSHANTDHFAGVADAAAAYGAREVVIAASFRHDAASNPPARAMLRRLDALDRPARDAKPGDVVPLGRGTSVEILWPPAVQGNDNDDSLVFRLTHAGRSVLFTGDVEGGAMSAMLADPTIRPKLRCDVLVAPHHGSSEGPTADFLAAAAPTAVVASNARRLTGKQRAFDATCADAGVPLFRTHDRGALTVRLSAAGVAVEPFLTPR